MTMSSYYITCIFWSINKYLSILLIDRFIQKKREIGKLSSM